MQIQQIPINQLKPAEYNPRKITKQELDKLKNGIKEFGCVDPLIINKDLTVIGGHQRLKAIKALKWDKAPCNILDIPKDKEKLLNLSLNRISGEWDEEKLQELLNDLANMPTPELDLTGFDTKELDKLMEEYGGVLEEKEEELAPFVQNHILLSFPPEKLIELLPYIEKIREIEGVEYEQSAN